MRLLILAIAALLPVSTAAAGELSLAQAGDMPVILTAPHGGREEVPGCEVRTPVGARFVTSVDRDTDTLAVGVAEELRRLTGRQPYLVVARFHRRYIDANRARDEAYGGAGCQAEYDRYHAAIRRFVDEVRGRYPRGMLFDLHGQAAYPDSILRGTRHGLTVAGLIARAGADALTGPDSVFGRFAAAGYRIVPSSDTAPTDGVEAPGYMGGHTVAIYGSNNADGIDAMQIEFGLDLRRDASAVERTAREAARAIAAFYERYLR